MNDTYQKIAELISKGRKLEAIKLLRETTGVGLKQAKEEIERLSREMSGEGQAEGHTEHSAAQASPEQVRVLAEQGNKIEAIKVLRELEPGLSLKEAKQRVDAMTGRSGCLGSLLLLGATGLLLLLILV